MSQNGLLFVTESAQREEAMSWLVRLSDDDVNERVVSDWMTWYQASDGNKHAFDTLQEFASAARSFMTTPPAPGACRPWRIRSRKRPKCVRGWVI